METGWISLHRSLSKKGYYKDSEYVHLWVHLLLAAVYEPTEFLFNNKVEVLQPGQLITGRLKLARETGIDENKVTRILKCFENEQQIEQRTTNSFRLITIKNWNEYQKNEQRNEQPVNSQRTTSEQPVNTYNNINNNNNINNISSCKEIEEVKKKEKLFEIDSLEMGLVNLLCEEMRKNNPKVKISNLQKWAGEVDKMIRLDSRSEEEIKFLILWSQQDSFWKANILSMGKLREKFDQLMIKARSDWEAKQKNKILSF